MKIITFDIGGTKIAKAVIEIQRSGRFKILDYENIKNPINSKLIRKIFLDFSTRAKEKYKTRRVGISSARLVNDEKKTVGGAKKYYGKENFNFNFLQARGFDLRMDNDGSCFALGEYFQMKKKPKVLLGVAFGTGIGGGLVIDGKSYKGAHSASMEVGHMMVEKGGEECFCGQKGCWEAYAGGRGIERRYQELSGTKKNHLFDLAASGDRMAKKALKRSEDYAVAGVVNLLNIFDPEMVVFGGGISKHKCYMDGILKKLKTIRYNNKKQANYRFRVTKFGHQSNLLGAAGLWL